MPPGLEFKGGVNRTVILCTTLFLIGTIFKCCFTPDLNSLLDNMHDKELPHWVASNLVLCLFAFNVLKRQCPIGNLRK